jgi:hypothetical protein
MITPEELKYLQHPKMQERFREAMGPWQVGDWCYKNNKLTVIYRISTQGIHCANRNEFFLYPDDEKLLRFPSPSTGITRRGLVGMIKGFIVLQAFYEGDDVEQIGEWGFETIEEGQTLASTPTLVLLKALAAQIGAEVEG